MISQQLKGVYHFRTEMITYEPGKSGPKWQNLSKTHLMGTLNFKSLVEKLTGSTQRLKIRKGKAIPEVTVFSNI